MPSVARPFLLVGAYTWLVPIADEKQKETPVDERNIGDAPNFERNDPGGDEDLGELEGEHQDADGEQIEGELPEREGEVSQKDHDTDQPIAERMEIRVFRMTLPLKAKNANGAIWSAMEMVMGLQVDGFDVQRVHTDRGQEFHGRFDTWAMNRGFAVSRPAGDDPTANGGAEVAVQFIKGMVRKSLHQAGASLEMWPLAGRHVNKILRCYRRGEKVEFPPMLTKVLVQKRAWKKEDLDTTMHAVSYICPAWLSMDIR